MLVDRVPVDLDKLLENRRSTAGTLDGEAGRVVEVAVYGAVVLVVRVLWAEDGRAHLAREVLDVELHVCERETVRMRTRRAALGEAHREP